MELYCDFSRCQPLPYWILKFYIYIGTCGLGVKMHHYAEFYQNWSNSFWDITIFWCFKMAAAAILEFRNSKILLAGRVCRIEMNHCVKFCQNLSICCRVIVIFQDGGCLPSWICLEHIWTTHEEYCTWWSLSLCKIWLQSNAVVSKIWKFAFFFTHWFENVYSRPNLTL